MLIQSSSVSRRSLDNLGLMSKGVSLEISCDLPLRHEFLNEVTRQTRKVTFSEFYLLYIHTKKSAIPVILQRIRSFFMKNINISLIITAILLPSLLFVGCKGKSPEDLPKYKKRFRTQIASFENQKEKADERVEDGVSTLTGIQKALENAKNVDAEFKKVYGKWEKVNKEVEDLNKEYEKLKSDAENLFAAMERQTASLNDEKAKTELSRGIKTNKDTYNQTLAKTSEAIGELRTLHDEAKDVIKALEVAVALGEISGVNEGLKNIQDKVTVIMADLNESIKESKEMYEQKMGGA